jgi:hypothetical protein
MNRAVRAKFPLLFLFIGLVTNVANAQTINTTCTLYPGRRLLHQHRQRRRCSCSGASEAAAIRDGPSYRERNRNGESSLRACS